MGLGEVNGYSAVRSMICSTLVSRAGSPTISSPPYSLPQPELPHGFWCSPGEVAEPDRVLAVKQVAEAAIASHSSPYSVIDVLRIGSTSMQNAAIFMTFVYWLYCVEHVTTTLNEHSKTDLF